jgi:hypothetical protein
MNKVQTGKKNNTSQVLYRQIHFYYNNFEQYKCWSQEKGIKPYKWVYVKHHKFMPVNYIVFNSVTFKTLSNSI